MTLDTPGCEYAFPAGRGGNCSRRDGSHNCTNDCRGTPGTSAGLAASGINNVQVAAVEYANMNNIGENSAVGEKIGDEEEGQGNGDCE